MKKIHSEETRARVLCGVARSLRGQVVQLGFAVASNIQSRDLRALALAHLTHVLTGSAKHDVIREVLTTASEIADEEVAGDILRSIASELRGDELEIAVGIVRRIQEQEYRAEALIAFLPQQSSRVRWRLGREVLSLLRDSGARITHGRIIEGAARYLPSSQIDDLVALVRGIARVEERAAAMADVIHGSGIATSRDVFTETWVQILRVDNEHWRIPQLRKLVPHLVRFPDNFVRATLGETLHFLCSRPRRELFRDVSVLLPAMVLCGGEGLAEEVWRACNDVANWWP
jgi:hypothetical protein